MEVELAVGGVGEEEKNNNGNDEEELKQRLETLESTLQSYPDNYETHSELISILRRLGMNEKLHAARENMSSKMPLAAALWQEWIEDEKKIQVFILFFLFLFILFFFFKINKFEIRQMMK